MSLLTSRNVTGETSMEYVRLGETGLKISRLALGCMSYGDPATPGAHRWALNDDDAQPFFRQAVELGITFWDTSNNYQNGTSEEFVGRAVTRYSRREDIVLATKVFGRMHDGPGGQGLSRKAILEQVDASLARLGTDYIDLYQIHRFDPGAPVEETMEALHDIVKAGKARYIGASSMYAWQFAKLQHAAELHGWTTFVSMQNQYNLLRRQDEPELMAMCADMGVGVVPYSPQGKGRLARPWGDQSHRLDRGPRGPVFRFTARRTRGQGRPARLRGPGRHHGSSRAGLGAEESRRICTLSSGQQSPITYRKRSQHSTCASPTRRSNRLSSLTNHTGLRGFDDPIGSNRRQHETHVYLVTTWVKPGISDGRKALPTMIRNIRGRGPAIHDSPGPRARSIGMNQT